MRIYIYILIERVKLKEYKLMRIQINENIQFINREGKVKRIQINGNTS